MESLQRMSGVLRLEEASTELLGEQPESDVQRGADCVGIGYKLGVPSVPASDLA